MRLQKYLALSGISSRRKAENLIVSGKVKVNGKIVNVLGTKVDPQIDKIEYKGSTVRMEKKIYFILNKPAGYTCTLSDPYAIKLVSELIPVNERIFPVGRLDRETEGLIMLTNDGDFAYKVIHPKHKIAKEYEVHIKDVLSERDINDLKKGFLIDGVNVFFDEINYLRDEDDKKVYKIVIYQGRKRQIRRMFEHIRINVVYLKRVRIGNINLGTLEKGKYRELSTQEISYFK